MNTFLSYDWPGNVRELENAIKRYVVLPDLELVMAELRIPEQQAVRFPQAAVSLKEIGASGRGAG